MFWNVVLLLVGFVLLIKGADFFVDGSSSVAKLLGVPMDDDGMNMEALEEVLRTHDKIRFIYTIPTFQNPSGITMSLQKRKRLYELAKQYKEEVTSLKEEMRQKDEFIRHQEEYIEELHRQTSSLHEKLDKANSRAAVFKILKCTKVDCGLRIPPFGSGAVDTIRQINEGTLGDEEARHEKE